MVASRREKNLGNQTNSDVNYLCFLQQQMQKQQSNDQDDLKQAVMDITPLSCVLGGWGQGKYLHNFTFSQIKMMKCFMPVYHHYTV